MAEPYAVEDYEDSYVGREAVQFIRDYDDSPPFAVFVGFAGPHEPWDAPGEYAQMYDPAQTPAPIPPSEPGAWVPPDAARWQRSLREPAMGAAQNPRSTTMTALSAGHQCHPSFSNLRVVPIVLTPRATAARSRSCTTPSSRRPSSAAS